MLELAQLRLDEGDLDAAIGSFERAHELVRTEFSGPDGLTRLAYTGTLVALAAGNPDTAQWWSEQVADPFWGGVGVARVRLFEGRQQDAAALLDGLVSRNPRQAVVHDLLRARMADSHQQAMDGVARAMGLASTCGLVQTVASEGSEVLALVEIQAWIAPEPWLDRVRRAASPQAGGTLSDPSRPGDHLTERELEVLRMLPSRLTLREIAGELFISVNTLKFHLRVIYRKLGVGSRAEAIEVARRRASPTGSRARSNAAGV
jgi:LuxR family maltose regulon positive regulatory protein